ncbi:AbaSI family restriction endonuclease [Glutamicibacter sp.]|uniref:AbaSI family restriction endonuclease n=1 Tax=Glutamicibacter sp. TaxID=1931995 RepID=UPI002FDF2F40
MRAATRDHFEYLVATLSKRTARKKYENYVVNAIWNELDDETLKPVTQQHVNRRVRHRGLALVDLRQETAKLENEQRALIDLYFPSLRLGIECDEEFHGEEDQKVADEQRTADIKRAIRDYHEIRISVVKDKVTNEVLSPENVLRQIDSAVAEIKERKRQVEAGKFDWASRAPIEWKSNKKDWQLAKEAGMLRAGDGLFFKHNGEIRELFGLGDGTGTKYNTFYTNFNLKDSTDVVWCPKLAKEDATGKLSTDNTSGCLNWLISEDAEIVIGEASASEESKQRRTIAKAQNIKPLPAWEYELSDEELHRRRGTPDWLPPTNIDGLIGEWQSARRITFVKTKDSVGRVGFQFLGVFTPVVGYRESNGVSFKVCKLISETVELPKT